ncbi:hypothetical protein E0494_08805 [Marinilabiliaceae bacterium JC040]|nr:hypothetical protein [Marinilabiliaceae bacterium JC040]
MKKSYLLLLVVLIMSSCSSNVLIEKSKVLENHIWSVKDTLHLKVLNKFQDKDTYKLSVKIKHTDAFATNNLWFYLCKKSKDVYRKDTIMCMLSDKYGKWLGKKNGDYYERKIILFDTIKLNKGNKYSLIHGMRELNLKGIETISLLIEKNIK